MPRDRCHCPRRRRWRPDPPRRSCWTPSLPSPRQKRFSRLKIPLVCLYRVTNSPNRSRTRRRGGVRLVGTGHLDHGRDVVERHPVERVEGQQARPRTLARPDRDLADLAAEHVGVDLGPEVRVGAASHEGQRVETPAGELLDRLEEPARVERHALEDGPHIWSEWSTTTGCGSRPHRVVVDRRSLTVQQGVKSTRPLPAGTRPAMVFIVSKSGASPSCPARR